VTERFMALTSGRYAQVSFDPALKTRAVVVGGEPWSPAALSVGTREQLATIVRLALAAQLKSVVLLDDQLVQSDPTRLEWFRQALRTTVRDQQHQVLVFTCRTGDYLTQDELPKPTESQHESDEGRLLSTDLEKVIRRVDRP
jgi:uncharacterized protein YhaN